MENNVECGMCSGRGWFKVCGTRWRCIDCDGTGKDPPKCECGACEYRNGAWMWYSEWMEDCTPTGRLVNVKHCPDKCGCRLSVEAGEPRVGPSVRAVIEKLMEADDACEEDAGYHHDGLDDNGDGALAFGKQIGYRYAIRLLGGETDE